MSYDIDDYNNWRSVFFYYALTNCLRLNLLVDDDDDDTVELITFRLIDCCLLLLLKNID